MGAQLQQLQVTTAEDRSQIQRWRSVVRWGATVAGVVVAALALSVLGIHR